MSESAASGHEVDWDVDYDWHTWHASCSCGWSKGGFAGPDEAEAAARAHQAEMKKAMAE